MTEHLQEVVDYVMGDDDSELAKTKAELAYALHSLEREIAIAQSMQSQNDALVKALEDLLECADSECVSGSSFEPIEAAKNILNAVKGAPGHG